MIIAASHCNCSSLVKTMELNVNKIFLNIGLYYKDIQQQIPQGTNDMSLARHIKSNCPLF